MSSLFFFFLHGSISPGSTVHKTAVSFWKVDVGFVFRVGAEVVLHVALLGHG